MTFERAAELAMEFRKDAFDNSWANAVANAGPDIQAVADAFYAGPPSSSGDAFSVIEKWLDEKHPDISHEEGQEVLHALSSDVAGKILAGVDDGLEIAVEMAPDEDPEYMSVLAESVSCRKISFDNRLCRMKFTEVRKAEEAFRCLSKVCTKVAASSRLSHTVNR